MEEVGTVIVTELTLAEYTLRAKYFSYESFDLCTNGHGSCFYSYYKDKEMEAQRSQGTHTTSQS